MRALILNILPQLMIVVGLAGMAAIVIRKGFPFKNVIEWDRVRRKTEIARKVALERIMHLMEKMLRRAKILAMRLERFFSGRLESLVARKSDAPQKSSFWENIRGRRIALRKAKTSRQPPAEIASPDEKMSESVLARLAKERDEEQSGKSGDSPV